MIFGELVGPVVIQAHGENYHDISTRQSQCAGPAKHSDFTRHREGPLGNGILWPANVDRKGARPTGDDVGITGS